ncbi:hypothetical protein PTE30175_02438 [Pandoraea terrae]|uniref:Uncharacterized protein n=1 Tax=Pandoraea terrae TaxID=1537710 RepID=A0A5E4VAS8_9BURK|nr:hypothetical protein [Pandoraea terrae]VVE08479.1 hypothetical protein PTE30175_02438 [Pandoraea terrae]
MEFNRVGGLLVALAKENGLTSDDLEAFDEQDDMEWRLPFWGDLDESFNDDAARLQSALDLYEKALAQGDKLTACAGLIRACGYAHNLMSFFDALRHDLNKASLDARFNWPKFPEGYKIPRCYHYEE